MNIKIRHAEPNDYLGIQQIYTQPKAVSGTLQLPYPSAEFWRKRLTDKPDNLYSLVACIDGEIIGILT